MQVEGRGPGKSKSESNTIHILPSVSSRADEIFRSLDVDGDGEITQQEFIDGYLKMHTTVGGKQKWSPKFLVNKNGRGVMNSLSLEVDKLYRAYS